jgi:hypothetical protein
MLSSGGHEMIIPYPNHPHPTSASERQRRSKVDKDAFHIAPMPGLFDHAIAQMGDTGRGDDVQSFQRDRLRTQVVEQAHTATE